MGTAPGFEQGDLFRLVHEGLEAELCGRRELARVGNALEQHDARAAAGRPQHDRLLEPRDRERVGRGQGLGHGHEAMAVGVGLDDRQHPAAGRELADPRKIVLERRGVDDGAQGRAQNAPSP